MYLAPEQTAFAHRQPAEKNLTIQSLLEQGSGEVNEDVLLQEERLFGVFDGATSLDNRRFQDGLTGGLLAARTAARSFQGKRCRLDKMAGEANRCIHIAQAEEGISLSDRHKLWSTSLAVVQLHDGLLEYCQTGDALILVIYRDNSYKVLTPEIDVDQVTLQMWKEMQVSPGTPIFDVLGEQIHKVRLEMNVSYGVLNGEARALDFIRHGYEGLAEVSDILLFTDGLYLPRENPLDGHDWPTFISLYRKGGLSLVRDHVRQLQRQDPGCRHYPRFKMHDDIAAVAISC